MAGHLVNPSHLSFGIGVINVERDTLLPVYDAEG